MWINAIKEICDYTLKEEVIKSTWVNQRGFKECEKFNKRGGREGIPIKKEIGFIKAWKC